MKTIYITGIAGMLGSNLLYELKSKYNITGCDMVRFKKRDFHTDCFDLRNYEELDKSITNARPDVLIHTAAMVNVDLCEEQAETAGILNTEITKQIAGICEKNDIKLIYISTDAVFDGEKCGLYTEEDVTNPVNVYGKTKLGGEVSTLARKQNLVFRTNIYGYNYQEKNSFGEWILEALQQRKELQMFSDILFSPILVNDLAVVIDKAIEKDLCGLYHACGTGAVSKYAFGCKMKEIFEIETGTIRETKSKFFPFKAKRAQNMGMSNQKLCNVLGTYIRTPEESIEKFKELYMSGYRRKLRNVLADK